MEEFIEVPAFSFLTDDKCDYSLFVRINNDKYVKVQRAGMSNTLRDLSAIKKDRSLSVFVKKNEFESIFRSKIDLTTKVSNTRNIPYFVRFRTLTTSFLILEKIIPFFGKDFFKMHYMNELVEACNTTFTNEIELDGIMRAIEKAPQSYMVSSLVVSALSIKVAKELGWTREKTYKDIIVGSILRDVAVLLNDGNPDFSFENHPIEGSEIVSGLGRFSTEVTTIIREHQEYSDGSGFPAQLREFRISPLGKIIILCQSFWDHLNEIEADKMEERVKLAVNMMNDHQEKYNKKYFKVFKALIYSHKI